MSLTKQERIELVDNSYNKLFESIMNAMETADENGVTLLKSLNNFAHSYLEYYKRILISGAPFAINTYEVFKSAIDNDYLYLVDHRLADLDALREVKYRFNKFFDAAMPIKEDKHL